MKLECVGADSGRQESSRDLAGVHACVQSTDTSFEYFKYTPARPD